MSLAIHRTQRNGMCLLPAPNGSFSTPLLLMAYEQPVVAHYGKVCAVCCNNLAHGSRVEAVEAQLQADKGQGLSQPAHVMQTGKEGLSQPAHVMQAGKEEGLSQPAYPESAY